MGRIFGTDGVRGIANEKLDAELAIAISRAAGMIIKAEGTEKPKIIVGRDTRLSGTMLEAAVAAGLSSVGCDVELLGVVPTPAVAYLVTELKADGGVMITASHNPFEYNGIKYFGSTGFKLTDEQEAIIEGIILDKKEPIVLAHNSEIGKVHHNPEAIKLYIEHIAGTVTDLSGIKVAVDCANGASYKTAKEIFAKAKVEATFISCEPNGINVNKNCGSLHTAALGEFVKKGGFDIGVAFDGDADRCLAVDEKGELIDGDMMMAILAKRMHEEGKLNKNMFIPTIMSNMGLFKFAEKYGFTCYPTKVGDRYVLENLLKYDASLGGEQSGHIILPEYMTTGDGELSALKLIESMKISEKKASELKSLMTVYPQVTLNIDATEEMKERLKDEEVKSYISIENARLNGNGRVLVRPSGTEPFIRITVEGPTQEKVEAIAWECAETLKNLLAEG